MAGSNGSPAQRGGPPPHWPDESEEQARALELERWRHQQAQAAQHGYSHSGASPQHGYQQPAPGFGQPASYGPGYFGHPPQQDGYAQPHIPEHNAPDDSALGRNPFEPPFGDPAHHQQAQNAPHFERFAPVPSPMDYPSGYDPHQLPGGHPEHVQDPFNPQRAPSPFDAHQGFDPNRGFGALGVHPSDQHQGHLDARADPQSWDLSNYHTSQIPQGYHDPSGGHDPHAPLEWGSPAPAGHDAQWLQSQSGQGHWAPNDGLQQAQHYDHNAPDPHQHYHLDPNYDHDDQHLASDLASDEYDVPEEPRRRPSVVLVIGMLVGAIVVGGGLAFAYRHLGGGGGGTKVAEIKRQAEPEKVRPDNPGGKQIAHSGNAFLNRSKGAPGETRQSDVDGSAKKVATIPIVVNRDGSMTSQPSAASATLPSDGSGVPGLVLDGLGPPPAAPQLRPGTGPTPTDAPASRLPPPPPPVERTPPRVADLPLPKVMNAPPPQAPQATAAVERPAPPPPLRKPAVPPREERVAARTGAGAVGAADVDPPAVRPAVSRNGYVAVLASKRSRQEALNTFADLHSQFPDILGGVTPDVREANLGDRGVWYRLIGGPPGSREAALGICTKLKSRGMKDCWPVAY